MAVDTIHRGLEDITVAETRLSRIDGEAGEPVIAGYRLDELATAATFEERLVLLLEDRLPDADGLAAFRADLADRREIGEAVRAVLQRAATDWNLSMDALRMGGAASTPGSGDGDALADARRTIAVFPTIVAAYWRYRQGADPVPPRTDLGHAANPL